MNLVDQYTRLCGDTTSDIYQHLPTFVQAVNELRATKVIELGVRAGCSTIAWLYALADRGVLWSVDGAPPCNDDDGTDLLGQYMDEERSSSILDHWVFLKGWDNEAWVQQQLPKPVDIIFVDTNHTYEMTTDELNTFVPFVRPGGRLFFHDTNIIETGNATTPQPPYPVRTAILDYCEDKDLTATFVDYSMGLGTIYV